MTQPTSLPDEPFGAGQAPAVCLGLARRGIEEFRELALVKQLPFGGGKMIDDARTHVGLARAEALLRSARSYWYEHIEQIWGAAVEGRRLPIDEQAAMRMASLTAVENSVAAVDMLHDLAGASAIFQ